MAAEAAGAALAIIYNNEEGLYYNRTAVQPKLDYECANGETWLRKCVSLFVGSIRRVGPRPIHHQRKQPQNLTHSHGRAAPVGPRQQRAGLRLQRPVRLGPLPRHQRHGPGARHQGMITDGHLVSHLRICG